ncbi:MAG TPA: efflux RND transporter periplasmic adaptor subunit [Candidatus Saccharimonadales bacterium]|jgi:HlyD family secretion protein|nr:efflux RND transporter periplasmic adaptor subunit [Candidatus Saccharimonadales bacterium]
MKTTGLIQKFRGERRLLMISAGGLVLLLGAAGVAWHHTGAPTAPTADVVRGEFVDFVEIRGDIKAVHSVQLVAPPIGGDLQIVKLVPTGTIVKKGDIVAQFDTSNFDRSLEQKQSELKSAQADIEHMRAEARLSQEQQATDVLQARFDVDRARLDVSKQEILSKIDGAETRLKLTDSEQKLKEMHQKSDSTKKSGAADVERKKQKQEKSRFDVERARNQVEVLTVRAPADGMVTIMPNFRVRNWATGTVAPDFKEGDRAWSGALIAELPDLSAVRASARVEETDRGRLKAGQDAMVRIDAIADKEFKARVAEISPLAKVDYSVWPFTKNFSIEVEILEPDSRIRPGMSASGRIAVERVAGSILAPVESVFEKNGGLVAYVLTGSKFEERTVRVARRGRTQLLISSGLKPGDKVALKDPTETGGSAR